MAPQRGTVNATGPMPLRKLTSDMRAIVLSKSRSTSMIADLEMREN